MRIGVMSGAGDRTYKLHSDTTSEYGRYVKYPGVPVAGGPDSPSICAKVSVDSSSQFNPATQLQTNALRRVGFWCSWNQRLKSESEVALHDLDALLSRREFVRRVGVGR